jgi:hypothetical protein
MTKGEYLLIRDEVLLVKKVGYQDGKSSRMPEKDGLLN